MTFNKTAVNAGRTSKVAALVCVGLLGLACESNDGEWPEPVVIATVPTSNHIVYVDAASAQAFAVSAETQRVSRIPLPEGPVAASRLGLRNEVLVLSAGTPEQLKDDRDEDELQPPQLAVIAQTADGHTVSKMDLPARFNAVDVAPTGNHALLSFRGTAGTGDTVFNPNEIAIVNLSNSADIQVHPRTIRSFGGVPTGVSFSPPLTIAGVERHLAVVFSERYVTLLDLDHPDRSEITVRLTLPDDTRSIQPVEVLYEQNPATMYVRATGADDIYALRLREVTPDESNGNDYRPSLDQFAVGKATSMALVIAGAERRLLATTPATKSVALVDLASNQVTTIPLDVAADQIFLFQSTAPGETALEQRALLWAAGNSSISFLDLKGVEELRGRNVETRSLGAPVHRVFGEAGHDQVVVTHTSPPNSTSHRGISVVSLAQRTAAPLNTTFDGSSATYLRAANRFWMASRSIATGEDFFSNLTLDENLQHEDVTIGAPTQQLILGGAEDDMPQDWLAAIHPSVTGHVTFIDPNAPQAEARVARGFLLSDLLERGGE